MSLPEAARETIAAWKRWCDAEGWDNPEYDGLATALNRLANALRAEHADAKAIAAAEEKGR